MKIGYCRISTKSQNFNLQEDALKKDGCEKIYKDIASGSKAQRKELDAMLSQIRSEDIIVVYKIDRLGRSLKHLIELINQLTQKGVGLRSLNDPIDTTTAQGRLITNIFASMAEFERDLIRERTQAGLTAARSRGKQGGRPKGLSNEAQATAMVAETLYKEGELSTQKISDKLKISKSTLYKYLRYRGVEIGNYNKTNAVDNC